MQVYRLWVKQSLHFWALLLYAIPTPPSSYNLFIYDHNTSQILMLVLVLKILFITIFNIFIGSYALLHFICKKYSGRNIMATQKAF